MNEREFREKLTPEQYRVMRQKGTETAFTGKYWDSDEHGVYICAACDCALFSSLQKFDAGTGWPSFYKPLSKRRVELHRDTKEQEISCAHCQSHLGYMIEGEKTYYRINSLCLDFIELGELELEESYEEKRDEKKSDDERKSAQAQTGSSLVKTFSFVIGGIVVGAVAILSTGSFYLCPADEEVLEQKVLPASNSTPTTPPVTPREQTSSSAALPIETKPTGIVPTLIPVDTVSSGGIPREEIPTKGTGSSSSGQGTI